MIRNRPFRSSSSSESSDTVEEKRRKSEAPERTPLAAPGARVMAPPDRQKPCLWILCMGGKQPKHLGALKERFESQATDRGYHVGYIETADDGRAMVHAIEQNVMLDTVLLLNTDASAQTVAAVRDWLRPRWESVKQIGAADGAPTNPSDGHAWHALDHLPAAAVSAEPMSVEELHAALAQLNRTSLAVVQSTPPRGSWVKDDLDLQLEAYETMDEKINAMRKAGLLDNPPPDLAQQISTFEGVRDGKRLAAQQRWNAQC